MWKEVKIVAWFVCLGLAVLYLVNIRAAGYNEVEFWYEVTLCASNVPGTFVSTSLAAGQACPVEALVSQDEVFSVSRSQFEPSKRYSPVVFRPDGSQIEATISLKQSGYELLRVHFKSETAPAARRLFKSGSGWSPSSSSGASRAWFSRPRRGRAFQSSPYRSRYGRWSASAVQSGTDVVVHRLGPTESARSVNMPGHHYFTSPHMDCSNPAVGCYYHTDEAMTRDGLDASFELFPSNVDDLVLTVNVDSVAKDAPATEPFVFVTFYSPDGVEKYEASQRYLYCAIGWGLMCLALTLWSWHSTRSARHSRGSTDEERTWPQPPPARLKSLFDGMWMEVTASYVDGDRVSTALDFDDLVDRSTLTALDLYSNDVERIEGIGTGDLPRLARLNLRENNLTSIAGVGAAQGLRFLDLSSNDLVSVDWTVLGGLPVLSRLDVSNNDLVGRIELQSASLQWFSAANNDVYAVHIVARSMRYLDVSSNNLTSAQGLEECSALEELQLHDNDIADTTALFALRRSMPRLALLTLGNNELSSTCFPQLRELFGDRVYL